MSLFDKLSSQSAGEKKDFVSSETITFEQLPETLDQMKALPQAALTSPYLTAALAVCALCCYAVDRQNGKEMLDFLRGPKGPLSNYDIQFLNDRFMDKPYVAFSYFEGAKPENDYRPDEPYKITFFSDVYSFGEEGYAKLNVRSGGADSPRQIVLRRKGGQWFLWEQYILVGIRTPASKDPWA